MARKIVSAATRKATAVAAESVRGRTLSHSRAREIRPELVIPMDDEFQDF